MRKRQIYSTRVIVVNTTGTSRQKVTAVSREILIYFKAGRPVGQRGGGGVSGGRPNSLICMCWPRLKSEPRHVADESYPLV